MEDRNAAQVPTRPLGLVFIHLWVHRLQKRPYEGHFPRGSDDRSFIPEIFDCDAFQRLLGARNTTDTHIGRMRRVPKARLLWR